MASPGTRSVNPTVARLMRAEGDGGVQVEGHLVVRTGVGLAELGARGLDDQGVGEQVLEPLFDR